MEKFCRPFERQNIFPTNTYYFTCSLNCIINKKSLAMKKICNCFAYRFAVDYEKDAPAHPSFGQLVNAGLRYDTLI